MAEDHIDAAARPSDIVEAETVEGMPVLADVRAIEPAPPAPLPAVQAAAVAATGFVAGAATMALVRRHAARKLSRSHAPGGFRRGGERLPDMGPGRTFLVHVHVIGRPGD